MTQKLTFAEMNNTALVDWGHIDGGISYQTYFVIGYKVHAQAQRDFQSNYVIFWLKNEPNANALAQAFWNAARDDAAHRASRQETLYMSRNIEHGSTLIHRRLWVRGEGKVLNIRVDAVDNNPFTLVGYSTWETAETTP
jgi:hypothetical protein